MTTAAELEVEGGDYSGGWPAWRTAVGGTPEDYVREWGGQLVLASSAQNDAVVMSPMGDTRRGSPDGEPAPPEPPRPTLRDRLLRRDQLGDLPQPAPLIDDTLDQRTVAVLAGRNSVGKSFLALDWACCITTGHTWQGRPVLAPGPVLYIAAEGAHGLDQRITAWEHAWHATATDLDVLPFAVNFFTATDLGGLGDILRARPYQLVIIDTWARSTVGGQENNNTDSTLAFDRLSRIKDLGPAVLVVAHTDGTDSKVRGATALEDNADTVYRMAGDATHIRLERTKRKDGPREDQHALSLLPVLDSCVIQSALKDSGQMSAKGEELLSTFADMFADTGATKAELRAVANQAPATFARSLSALLRAGALVNSGTDARPFYKQARTHEQ